VEGHVVETHDGRTVDGSLVRIYARVLVGGRLLGTPVLGIPVKPIDTQAGGEREHPLPDIKQVPPPLNRVDTQTPQLY